MKTIVLFSVLIAASTSFSLEKKPVGCRATMIKAGQLLCEGEAVAKTREKAEEAALEKCDQSCPFYCELEFCWDQEKKKKSN